MSNLGWAACSIGMLGLVCRCGGGDDGEGDKTGGGILAARVDTSPSLSRSVESSVLRLVEICGVDGGCCCSRNDRLPETSLSGGAGRGSP